MHTLIFAYVMYSDIYIMCSCINYGEPGSSVAIVSDYGLDDRTIEIRSPAEAKGVFL
jgi:hypothetical protein